MQKNWRWMSVRALVVAVAAIAVAPAARAQSADALAFYKGKTVRIVVGYVPGGGYDSYARLITPYLETRLGATVIVENKPGGGGFNALGALLRDPGDGLRMQLLNGEAAVLAQLVELAGIRFDMRKLVYLGRVSYENRTLVARAGGPLATLEGFRRAARAIHFGSDNRIDSMGDPASILCHALSLKCKIVTGFKGATEVALALQRDEIDAMVTSESQVATMLAGSSPLVAVAVLATRRAPLLPGVPSVFDLVSMSPEQSRWLRFRADLADIGRVLVVPGDTPPDRIAVLQNAVASVLDDPAVQAEGQRTNRPIAHASSSQTRALVDKVLDTIDADARATLKHVVLQAY